MRRTALLVAVLAAAGTMTGTASAKCVYVGSLASNCTLVDTGNGCVATQGHVDMYRYEVACSPR